MMVSTMVEGEGEARVRSRRSRRVRRGILVATATLAVMAGVPFAYSFADGLAGRSHTSDMSPVITAAMAAALLLIVAASLGIGWREADEVQRRIAVNTGAAAGVVAIIGYPVMEMAAPILGIADFHEGLWWASLGAAALAFLIQRVKG